MGADAGEAVAVAHERNSKAGLETALRPKNCTTNALQQSPHTRSWRTPTLIHTPCTKLYPLLQRSRVSGGVGNTECLRTGPCTWTDRLRLVSSLYPCMAPHNPTPTPKPNATCMYRKHFHALIMLGSRYRRERRRACTQARAQGANLWR